MQRWLSPMLKALKYDFSVADGSVYPEYR